jgi:hypothetical protein
VPGAVKKMNGKPWTKLWVMGKSKWTFWDRRAGKIFKVSGVGEKPSMGTAYQVGKTERKMAWE